MYFSMSRTVSRKGTKKLDFKMSFSYETGMTTHLQDYEDNGRIHKALGQCPAHTGSSFKRGFL